MSNFDNMYLKRKKTEFTNIDDMEDFFVYFKVDEVDDFVIVRKESTINDEGNEVVPIEKGKFNRQYYSLRKFFENALFVGSSGYYDFPGNDLDRYLYQDWFILYRDNDNEFIYDNLLGKFIVRHIYHKFEDFVPLESDIKVPEYDIKKYLR